MDLEDEEAETVSVANFKQIFYWEGIMKEESSFLPWLPIYHLGDISKPADVRA